MRKSRHLSPQVCITVVIVALVLSCTLNTGREPTDAEVEEAVAFADEMTVEASNLLIEARVSGDTTELDSFAVDLGVETIIGDGAAARMQPAEISDIDSEACDWVLDNAVHGDVLLFTDIDGVSWTHELMKLLLVGDYYHAGVFVDEDGIRRTGDEYLVSASIRISQDGTESGVLIQNIEDLTANSLRIGRLATGSIPGGDPLLDAALANLAGLPPEATLYSFLYPNLDPVPRDDDFLWYCSKVSWRAFAETGKNTEYRFEESSWVPSMDFYLVEDRWMAFQDTVIFRLYRQFLTRFLGRWPALVERLTIQKLQKVLTELITPDEVFYWGVNYLGADVSVWGDPTSIWY
jgi:hypothetical protein